MSRAIQRHRDVYQDYARELKRTKVRSCEAITIAEYLYWFRTGKCTECY